MVDTFLAWRPCTPREASIHVLHQENNREKKLLFRLMVYTNSILFLFIKHENKKSKIILSQPAFEAWR